jgi:cytochrome P450 family 6
MFTETLRKYPIVSFLERECSSEYQLPNRNGNGTVTLPVGTGVYIPVLGIHFDPMYFPEPEKFDPDHFTEDNKRRRPNYTYIPFGEGPRMCIGKDRHLMAQNKNFRFPSLGIKFSIIQKYLCKLENSWIIMKLHIFWETNS